MFFHTHGLKAIAIGLMAIHTAQNLIHPGALFLMRLQVIFMGKFQIGAACGRWIGIQGNALKFLSAGIHCHSQMELRMFALGKTRDIGQMRIRGLILDILMAGGAQGWV